MEHQSYNAAWRAISPLMLRRLADLATLLAQRGVSMTEPRQFGDEEWSQGVELLRDGNVIASLDFTLHDGDVHGEEGFSVSLTWSAADGTMPARRWAPYVYTAAAFSPDVAEIQRRIELELDPRVISSTVLEDLTAMADGTVGAAATT